MSASYVSPGDTIPYTPEAAVTGGDVVILGNGNMVCVATRDIAAGELGALCVDGVFEFPKRSEAAFEQGDEAYWHITSESMTDITDESSESDDQKVFAGLVTEEAETTDSTVKVRIKNAHND